MLRYESFGNSVISVTYYHLQINRKVFP